MVTKLGILCDRVIEAGWLTALAATPFFFNVHSSRIFEPDKLAILRSIALIMLLGWLVKGLEIWRSSARARKAEPGCAARVTRWQRQPVESKFIVLVVVLFFADYAVATATSIMPRVSLWGSYERLQGLYTTGAYLVLFLSVVALLRRREQAERLLTTALLVSLPVALYGIIQSFGADPVPWMGDVLERVSSTMGNPIFVGAFLIMVVPLTLYRLLETGRQVTGKETRGPRAVLITCVLLTLLLQAGAWRNSPITGSLAAAAAMAIWLIEGLLLHQPLLHFLRLSVYSILLSTQLVCLFLTQSRGPWLGLLSGLFLFVLLWTLGRRFWRWAAFSIGGALVAALFLVMIALPDSPLQFVRDVPYVGRLGRVFEGEGRVRLLIWQGAVELISADPLRTVIGYGPEAMKEAYPPYYSPQLGHVERRTVLPDRSHNETFDVLVTTGLVGFTLHLLLLTMLFYHGLKGAGVIRSQAEGRLFLGLWLSCGTAATLLFRLLDQSWRLVGVALPLGILAGLVAYLAWYGLRGLRGKRQVESRSDVSGGFLVVALLSAVAAHLIEMSFGIAIASTRVYFWTYAALLVVAGQLKDAGPCLANEAPTNAGAVPHEPSSPMSPLAQRSAIAGSLLAGFIMMTLIYEFLSPAVDRGNLSTIFWLLGFTWVFAGLLLIGEAGPCGEGPLNLSRGSKTFGMYTGVTLLCGIAFAAAQEGLFRLGDDLDFLPVLYYAAVLLVILAIGSTLLIGQRLPARIAGGIITLAYPFLAAAVLLAIVTTNLDLVRADIYHKQAWLAFYSKGDYDRAIALGRRSLDLEPGQDFYHLFLGHVLEEKAGGVASSEERRDLFAEAERTLSRARELNPLKLDHILALARLHHTWAQSADGAQERAVHFERAAEFYDRATRLSPNTPVFWNEWGRSYFLMGDEERALGKYQRSLALDHAFEETHRYLGDLYAARGQWQDAARAYKAAVEIDRAAGNFPRALAQARRALEVAPQKMRPVFEELITQLRRKVDSAGD